MAQVAILLNGTPSSQKTDMGRALAVLLGCPLISAPTIADALTAQTGPMAPAAGVRALAVDTVWRLAGLIEAGVVLDASWTSAGDQSLVRAGILTAGSPRTVEVWCDGDAEPLGVTPVVQVDTSSDVDMDALVQEISAQFV